MHAAWIVRLRWIALLSPISDFLLQVKKLPVTQSTGDLQSQERGPKIKLRHP